jgi:orotate phosphoribosyltransferase
MQTDYLRDALDVNKIPTTVDNIIAVINDNELEFDAIAFRGMSGAMIAPMVAVKLKKNLIMVRKEEPHQGHHSRFKVEGGIRDSERYVVVDDLVSSGATVAQIRRDIARINSETKFVGVVTYRCEGKFHSPDKPEFRVEGW